jgi:hypothetical protein
VIAIPACGARQPDHARRPPVGSRSRARCSPTTTFAHSAGPTSVESTTSRGSRVSDLAAGTVTSVGTVPRDPTTMPVTRPPLPFPAVMGHHIEEESRHLGGHGRVPHLGGREVSPGWRRVPGGSPARATLPPATLPPACGTPAGCHHPGRGHHDLAAGVWDADLVPGVRGPPGRGSPPPASGAGPRTEDGRRSHHGSLERVVPPHGPGEPFVGVHGSHASSPSDAPLATQSPGARRCQHPVEGLRCHQQSTGRLVVDRHHHETGSRRSLGPSVRDP